EYSGSGLGGLFAKKRNWFRPAHYAFLNGIARFGKECQEVLENEKFATYTLARYAGEKSIRPDVVEKFLIPMASAVWSTPRNKMSDFPIVTLVRFFKNHGFLGLNTQYPWRTVAGGSETYKKKILRLLGSSLHLGDPVLAVSKDKNHAHLRSAKGRDERFDAVIVACHADQALRMLESASSEESRLLRTFRYQKNTAILHTDSRLMPKIKKVWSSWNVRLYRENAGTTYWMNKLQPFGQRKNYFVTLDDGGEINPSQVLRKVEYEHPLFTPETKAIQRQLNALNESGPIYFTGSYFRYGFHEDAFTASLELCRRITGENIWPGNPGLGEEHGRLSG
ncbi:MAG: FAD-dependent oxidoreductase, partial [Spirochaetia bacterium]|nr:FAD-dependent oxidoreductase [Spirochaetia bacterium]